MSGKTKVRGHITYDEYFGHVCTCTAHDVDGLDADGTPVCVFTEYEPTVHVVRSVEPTESGSYYYACSRCGASGWSGL